MMSSRKRLVALGLGAALAAGVLGLAPQETRKTPIDNAQVARRLVNVCAGIRQGDLVLVNGGTRDVELLENIAIEIRKLGAHPIITLGSDSLTRAMFTDVPAKFDTQEPTFQVKLAETIDAFISIDFSEQPDLLADIDSPRLAAHSKAFEQVHKTMLERGVVNVHLGNGLYPTASLARQFGISKSELSTIFWSGVNVDYSRLQNIGANVRTKLTAGRSMRITAPNGTDLTLQITERPVFVSDGVVSSEDRYAGGPASQVWLPAGEIYVTPVPGTARGTFIADNFFFEGKRIAGLTLKFEEGRVTAMTAKSDITKLKQRYDAAPPGKEVFSAVDIGINPNVHVPAGSQMVTWMEAGTISVGIGNNAWAGGENTVPFDLFAHLTGGTLRVDGRKIVDQGRLIE